jgi:hypothetical protein
MEMTRQSANAERGNRGLFTNVDMAGSTTFLAALARRSTSRAEAETSTKSETLLVARRAFQRAPYGRMSIAPSVIASKAKQSRLGLRICGSVWIASLSLAMTKCFSFCRGILDARVREHDTCSQSSVPRSIVAANRELIHLLLLVASRHFSR